MKIKLNMTLTDEQSERLNTICQEVIERAARECAQELLAEMDDPAMWAKARLDYHCYNPLRGLPSLYPARAQRYARTTLK